MKHSIRFLICLFAVILVGRPAMAEESRAGHIPSSPIIQQGWRVHHYDNRDGLSHNSVKCIFEDSKGFVWFGTKNGLNRFDGREFKAYVYDGKPGSLRSSVIYDIVEDGDNHMWVATADGIFIYFPREDLFRSFEEVVKSDITISNIVWHLKKDDEGCIWILAQNGLYTYYDNVVTDLTDKILLHMETLPESMFIEGTTAYFGNMDGKVICCDRFCNRILNIASIPSAIWTIGEYGNDKLLLGTQQKGMFVLDVKRDSTYQISIKNNEPLSHTGLFVHSVCKVSETEYWVGSELGLLVIENDEMHPFQRETILSGTLDKDVPRAIFRDSHGNVWMGNYFGGIDIFTPNKSPFMCLDPSEYNAGCGKRIDCFVEDNNNRVWIGTEDNGLCLYDFTTGQFSLATSAEGEELTGFSVQCLTMISDDELLVGSTTEGIFKLNIHTGHLTHVVKDMDVYSLFVDSQGNVWAGIHSELCLFNKETGTFEVFKPEVGSFTHCIFEDANGCIWAVAMNQACRISLKDSSLKRFVFDGKNVSSPYHGCAVTGLCDSEGRLWFGFEEGGLCLFDQVNKTLTRATSINGSIGNGVYSIVEDRQGRLWLGTNNGLGVYDPQSQVMTAAYNMNDGLPTKQINYRAGITLRSGTLAFGTTQGFFAFDPTDVLQNRSFDDIIFTGIYAGDESIDRGIAYADSVRLRHDQTTFTISFSTLNYSFEGTSCFAYQLKGFDKGWNVLNDINRVSYHNVPSGNYTFCVHTIPSAIAKDDVDQGGVIASLSIYIQPFWYQTLAARLLITAMAIALIMLFGWLFFRSRKRQADAAQVEREKANEQKLYQAKIDFFTHVAHEIRTPASLIKDPVHRLRKKELPVDVDDTLAMVERNAEELNTLITELLDFRKLEQIDVAVFPKSVDIKRLVQDTWSRYAVFATDKGLRTSLSLPDEPLMAYIDPKATVKILNNLFSNAVKYASTYIRFTLSGDREQELASFSICNDGIRIPAEMKDSIFKPFVQLPNDNLATQGSGIGLALASTLSRMQNGTLMLNVQAVDNKFDLFLPLASLEEVEDILPEEVPTAVNIGEDFSFSPLEHSPSRSTILVVEDSKDMRAYLTSVLQDDYSILEAADGIEALEILENTDVQLVLTDVMMPRKDGLELCRDIKTSMDICHVPVVVLTAKDLLDDQIYGLECGAEAYIPKPFSADYLEAQIRSLLDNRTRLQNKYAHTAEATAEVPAFNKADRKFIEDITAEIIAHVGNDEFTIDDLSTSMAMSRSTLSRKIKAITGQTPGDFISLIRLKKAAELLREGSYRANEVCMMVGFNSTHYFTSIFKKQFGITPGAYAASVRNSTPPAEQ